MTDLEVIQGNEPPELPARPEYPEGLHLRLRYDADSCHAALYEGEDFILSTGYSWIKNYESWDECRANAINDAREKVATIQKYGKPPENEVVELDAAGMDSV